MSVDRTSTMEVTLPPSSSPYALVICAGERNYEDTFFLSILSDRPLQFIPLPHTNEQLLGTGGHQSGPVLRQRGVLHQRQDPISSFSDDKPRATYDSVWRDDPQYIFAVERQCRITLLMKVEPTCDVRDPQILFKVLSLPLKKEFQLLFQDGAKTVLNVADTQRRREVMASFIATPGCSYYVLPGSHSRGRDIPFTVSATTETGSDIELYPAKAWAVRSFEGHWTSHTSGGNRGSGKYAYASNWLNNPTTSFTVTDANSETILILEQASNVSYIHHLLSIGFTILEGPIQMGSRADPRQKIVGETERFEAKTEAVWRGHLQPGTYSVVLQT